MSRRKSNTRSTVGRGSSLPPPRVARPLDYSARRGLTRTKVVHSASPLISTVLGDTRRPRSHNLARLRSPVTLSRAVHRSTRVPSPWLEVFNPRPVIQRALTCAKRQIRKEVIHALKLTGKGAGASRRAYTNDSKEKCRG